MNDEITHLHMSLRGKLVRGVVSAIDDTGAEQMLTLDTHYGRTRSGVPVHHPFGFSSHAPLDGAIAPVLAVGGDPSDLVALPPSNPQAARFGDLGEGDSVVYDACGQRLQFHNGTLVEVQATSEMRVSIGGTTVFDLTAEVATFSVPVVAQKGITVTNGDVNVEAGDVQAAGISLRQHVHPVSGSVTEAPEG